MIEKGDDELAGEPTLQHAHLRGGSARQWGGGPRRDESGVWRLQVQTHWLAKTVQQRPAAAANAVRALCLGTLAPPAAPPTCCMT